MNDNAKLLTRIIVGRNDDYLGNFKGRLELAVNYTCNALASLGKLDQYELLIVDWNSEIPLRDVLNLNEAARECSVFLEVTPGLVREYWPGNNSPVFLSAALNVGVRRASAEMVMLTPSDVFFPAQSLDSLLTLMANPSSLGIDIKTSFLGVECFPIPWQAAERLTSTNLDRYFYLHTPGIGIMPCRHGVSGGEGAHIFSRTIFAELNGFDESHTVAAQDVDLSLRICQRGIHMKLTHFGVFCYDIYPPSSRRPIARGVYTPPSLDPVYDHDNWGIPLLILDKKKANSRPDVVNSLAGPIPYDLAREGSIYVESSSIIKIWLEKLWLHLLASKHFKVFLAGSFRKHPWSIPYGWGGAFLLRRAVQALLFICLSRRSPDNNSFFFSAWFGDKEKIITFISTLLPEGLFKPLHTQGKRIQRLADLEIFLALAITIGRIRPARFLYTPAREFSYAEIAAHIDPSIEIVGYDHWQGTVAENNPFCAVASMAGKSYKGFFQMISGPMETAFLRLQKIVYVGDPFQCIYLDLDYLEPILPDLPEQILKMCDLSCAIVCSGKIQNRKTFTVCMTYRSFTKAGEMPNVTILSRINP